MHMLEELYTYNDGQLFKAQQIHQARNQSSLDHHLDAVIRAIGQVGNGPTRVGQHLPVIMVQQANQSW